MNSTVKQKHFLENRYSKPWASFAVHAVVGVINGSGCTIETLTAFMLPIYAKPIECNISSC